MKIEPIVRIVAPDNSLEVYPEGLESAALFCGGRKVLSIGRIKTGKFSEELSLAAKLRRHFANDAFSAEAESENVIPFGCEYRVKRHWKYSGGIGELTCDIAADNGGRIDDLFLESILFPGQAEKVEYLLCGESAVYCAAASGVIYEGELLPVRVKVTFTDGLAAEFYCGDDFWRHNCASAVTGGSAMHCIRADEDGIRWERRVLITPEDAEVEKRPWRFKSLFAVSQNGTPADAAADAVIEKSGCFAAPVLRRDFRSFIRKTVSGKALLRFSGSLFCTDGSHINRPGKSVLHGMLGELFDEYIWANTVMARKEGTFAIDLQIPESQGSLITANLSRPPAELSDGEVEEL